MTEPSILIQSLARAVAENPLEPKTLVAPSHRIGRQWLDQAAMLNGCVANVAVAPLRRLMLDFAGPAFDAMNVQTANREEMLKLVGTAMAGASGAAGAGYFSRLPPSLAFAESLLRSLEDLENAGVKGTAALGRTMVTPEKSSEMAALFRTFRNEKRRRRLAGSGDIASAALDGLAAADARGLPRLLVPRWVADEAVGLERTFLSRWPEGAIRLLDVDVDGVGADDVETFTADCAANETREVLRRIFAAAARLDGAEVVCLDAETYVPLLCSAGLDTFGGRVEDLPFTFAGGVPALFSRPVRLVLAWLDWLRDGMEPAALADIVETGLLGNGWQKSAPGITASTLASRLKALPIQGGVQEYDRVLGRDESREDMRHAERWLAEAALAVTPMTGDERLADCTSESVLAAAEELLRISSENDGKLDAYARMAVRDAVRAWSNHADWPGFDAVLWLHEFASGLRVMGLGPQPGKLHISDGTSGGYSGRAATYVLGMDEGRCSSAARQDPILLDRERKSLSRHLRGSGWRREQREKAFDRLFARLRGRLIASHSQRDVAGGRSLYPSLLFSKLAGTAETPCATLRPRDAGACLNRRDDWLWAVLAKRRNAHRVADLAPWFPNLADGAAAAAARRGNRFTEWDGHVPEAGADFANGEWPLSPSQLEDMAHCPLDFFFAKVLGVRKPDRWRPEPGRWLAGNERGEILHQLFQDFMTRVTERDEAVSRDHERLLMGMLAGQLEEWRRRKPVRDSFAYARERGELIEAAVIFLHTEIARAGVSRPVCFEAAVGGAKRDVPPWQRVEPVRVDFSGVPVRLRGRVDRVDRLHGNGGLVIWDYKTGRSSGFSQTDPVEGGRRLQPYLYAEMLERALAEAGVPDYVREFSYFFPMPRDEGNVISYSREQLRGGAGVMTGLVGMIRKGCFPFARKTEDVKYSDYGDAHGDVKEMVAAGKRKCEENEILSDWRDLQK